MDTYQFKKDLGSFSTTELHTLARHYNLENLSQGDLVWMLALTIQNSFRAELPTGLLPLELTEDDEEFDGCQKMLVEWGAYDLVLIENATQIAKELYILPNLEIIMNAIGEEFKGITYLDSQTFQLRDGKLVQSIIKDYIKDNARELRGRNTIVTTLALDLEEAGGHYAAFILSPNKTLYVYDSMASSAEDPSEYLVTFRKLGEQIFKPKKVLLNSCININTYLQYTGGFPEHIDPPRLQKLRALYNISSRPRRRRISSDQDELCNEHMFKLRQQIPESQDHFCPMWSIWLIFAKINNIDINKVVQENKLIPLVIIKRFVWCIINYLQLNDDNKLYREYFPVVWLQTDYEIDQRSLSLDFKPYKIIMPDVPITSIEDCFNFSIEKMELVQLSRSRVPSQVYTALKDVESLCDKSTNTIC